MPPAVNFSFLYLFLYCIDNTYHSYKIWDITYIIFEQDNSKINCGSQYF